jgi:phosphate acetyltransferase
MKTKSIYIYPNEQRSGCRIVSLGVMSFLKRRIKKVAFFKPIIDDYDSPDDDVNFFQEYFQLVQSAASAGGVSLDEAKDYLLRGREDELLGAIVAKYKQLEDDYEFILCYGLRQNIFETLGFDLNVRIANSLAAPLAPVLQGKERNREDIINDLNIFAKRRGQGGAEAVFALFVNRVDPAIIEGVCREVRKSDFPVFLLPENPELDKLTMAEIAKALSANQVIGNETQLDRTVNQIRVAGMTPKNYLPRLRDGDLIIVPGDRDEIILSTILANVSRNYPSLAGILLTGGLRPDAALLRLLEGMDLQLLPAIVIEAETEAAAGLIRELKPGITLASERKISLALGIFDDRVDIEVLGKRVEASVIDVLTPVMFEHLLYEKAKRCQQNILLPESDDERILRAAEIAIRRGLARVTLLGKPDDVRIRCDSLGINLAQATIIDPADPAYNQEFAEKFYQLRQHKGIIPQIARDMVSRIPYFATMLLYCGYVDGIVSGATHTTRETIKPAFEIIKVKPRIKLVSSVFFMLLQNRVLVFGDCAVNPDPDKEELAQIAISSADTARDFGIEPRVAMLSYSSGGSGVGEEVEKVRQATAIVKQLRPDILVDGPIQYDAAIDPGVARIKLPDSPVAGRATVFIFPELNTGNNTYKAVQRAANALALGPVLQGLKKPVNDLSRGCLVGDILYTIAITSIQAGGGQ